MVWSFPLVQVALFGVVLGGTVDGMDPYQLKKFWRRLEPHVKHTVLPGGELVRIHNHGGRNIITDEYKKWTNGTVVYSVDSSLAQHCQTIVDAMAQISSDSDGCIQFRHRTPQDKNYVHLQSGVGCSSTIGMRPGGQTLILQDPGCTVKPTIMHELLHALGFCHEHTGPKRDKAIKILWENIDMPLARAKANFGAMPSSEFTDFQLGFDKDSIMLYYPRAFGKKVNGDRLYTMVSKIPGRELNEGPNTRLSLKDIIKLRMGYKCDAVGRKPPSIYLMCP